MQGLSWGCSPRPPRAPPAPSPHSHPSKIVGAFHLNYEQPLVVTEHFQVHALQEEERGFYYFVRRAPEAFPCSLTSPGRIFFTVTGPQFYIHPGNPSTRPSARHPQPQPWENCFQAQAAPGVPSRPRAQHPGLKGPWPGPRASFGGERALDFPRPCVPHPPPLSSMGHGAHRSSSCVRPLGTVCLPPVLAAGLLGAASCLACPRGWGGSSLRGWHRPGPTGSPGPQPV